MLDKDTIRSAIRNGANVYGRNGLEHVSSDICNRTFVLFIGNGLVDTSKNTAQGALDVKTCAHYLNGYCYRPFYGGRMEQVLEELVEVSYIKTPLDAIRTVKALRRMGIKGEIRLEVEYVEGHSVEVTTF